MELGLEMNDRGLPEGGLLVEKGMTGENDRVNEW